MKTLGPLFLDELRAKADQLIARTTGSRKKLRRSGSGTLLLVLKKLMILSRR